MHILLDITAILCGQDAEMSDILINFATGSYAETTAMPPDRANITGILHRRLPSGADGVTTFKRKRRAAKIIGILFSVFLLSFNRCRKVNRESSQHNDNIKTEFDLDFNTDYSWTDYVSIPLIEPYELSILGIDSLGPKWGLVRRDNNCFLGLSILSPINYKTIGIGINRSILYLSCKSTQSNKYKFMIIDTATNEIMIFDSIQKLADRLDKFWTYIEFANVDSVYTHFNSYKEEYSQKKLKPNIFLIIHKIVSYESTNGTLEIDSVRVNSSRIKPLSMEQFGGFEFVAYLKYRYPNGNIRSEGRVAFSEDPQDDLSQQYGEWKYYDIHGNCYRKFWVYEKGGKIFHETDR